MCVLIVTVNENSSGRDGLGVGMFGYENLAVFGEDGSGAGDVVAFCSGRNSGEESWFRCFQVSRLSDKASDLTCTNVIQT